MAVRHLCLALFYLFLIIGLCIRVDPFGPDRPALQALVSASFGARQAVPGPEPEVGEGSGEGLQELEENLHRDPAKAMSMWQQDRVHLVVHPDRLTKGWGEKHEARQKKGFRLKVNCEDIWEQTRNFGIWSFHPQAV